MVDSKSPEPRMSLSSRTTSAVSRPITEPNAMRLQPLLGPYAAGYTRVVLMQVIQRQGFSLCRISSANGSVLLPQQGAAP